MHQCVIRPNTYFKLCLAAHFFVFADVLHLPPTSTPRLLYPHGGGHLKGLPPKCPGYNSHRFSKQSGRAVRYIATYSSDNTVSGSAGNVGGQYYCVKPSPDSLQRLRRPSRCGEICLWDVRLVTPPSLLFRHLAHTQGSRRDEHGDGGGRSAQERLVSAYPTGSANRRCESRELTMFISCPF